MDAYQVQKLFLPPESILAVLLAAELIRMVSTSTYLSTGHTVIFKAIIKTEWLLWCFGSA
jgi:hypothetical protein